MIDPAARSARQEVQDLAERLTLEYAGALPAGQVLALVLRASRAAGGSGRARPVASEHAALTEQIARAWLVQRVARG